jgi:hypothetical protein
LLLELFTRDGITMPTANTVFNSPPYLCHLSYFQFFENVRIPAVSGGGLLIARNIYDGVRGATPTDLEAVLQLIRPLEQEGVLVYRVSCFATSTPAMSHGSETAAALKTMKMRQASDEILKGIENFTVVEREGTLVRTAEAPPPSASSGTLLIPKRSRK